MLGFRITCALEGVLRQTAIISLADERWESLSSLQLMTSNDVCSRYAMVSVRPGNSS